MAGTTADLREQIRRILLEDWDPHNIAAGADNSVYDPLIDPLVELIENGANEEAVADFLHQRELESMCFPSLGTKRLLPVARKLLLAGRALI